MNKFIKLTDKNGLSVYVNPRYVVSFGDNWLQITLYAATTTYTVKESSEEIAKLLEIN